MATPGRRLAAYILEVVIGAVLAGIIFSTLADKRDEVVGFGVLTNSFAHPAFEVPSLAEKSGA